MLPKTVKSAYSTVVRGNAINRNGRRARDVSTKLRVSLCRQNKDDRNQQSKPISFEAEFAADQQIPEKVGDSI